MLYHKINDWIWIDVMVRLFRKVYLFYCLFIFALFFILFLPLFLFPIIFKSQFKWIGILNRWWAKAVFTCCFLPYAVDIRAKLDPDKQYIFCPNHFSYVDIPAMGLNPHNSIFVGKHDMEKIPLFGYMYRKLHITVDRESLHSRYTTYKKSVQAIDAGKSLIIFPEGGIISTNFPQMARFKQGAFKLSVDKQIPIVPVTIPANWILLPDDLSDLRWRPINVIFHEPISPKNKTEEELKNSVHQVIDKELKEFLHQHENSKSNIG